MDTWLNTYEPGPADRVIAPTTGLVDQQMTMAKERLNLPEERIIAYTGDTAPDKRQALWESATAVMATPQVIRNDAMNGLIDLASVELPIDEAHRHGNHAYAQVGNVPAANTKGRVYATASPGSTLRNINEVRTNLNAHNLDLCKRMNHCSVPTMSTWRFIPTCSICLKPCSPFSPLYAPTSTMK